MAYTKHVTILTPASIWGFYNVEGFYKMAHYNPGASGHKNQELIMCMDHLIGQLPLLRHKGAGHVSFC